MGALVNSVEKGGPAEKAGVEAGDIIIKADGRDVRTSTSCRASSRWSRRASKVTLTVWRKGSADGDRRRRSPRCKEDVAGDAARGATPGAEGEGEAQPDGPRAGRPHRRAEEGGRRARAACWSRTSPAGVRGNVQPGDVILAIVSRGVTTEAKIGRAGQRPAGEGREGRVGDAAAEARRAAVLRDGAAAERRMTQRRRGLDVSRDVAAEAERAARRRAARPSSDRGRPVER